MIFFSEKCVLNLYFFCFGWFFVIVFVYKVFLYNLLVEVVFVNKGSFVSFLFGERKIVFWILEVCF